MSDSNNDELKSHRRFMDRALELARRGAGFVSPNPMVGAVVVKDNKIIGEGYHEEYGENHAEVNALEDAGSEARGAVLYVTLEPCSHYGKTPPCTKSIQESGIERVVIANRDPNPRVAGEGCSVLREAGIELIEGVLSERAKKLNEIFFSFIKKKRPFIVQKAAQTLDGYLAASSGDSKWITGKEARSYGHKLRHRLDSVLVGGQTVIEDDPRLSVRDYEGRKSQPVKIIAAGSNIIPARASFFSAEGEEVLIFAESKAADRMKDEFASKNDISVFATEVQEGRLNLREILEVLYRRDISSVLIEGGGKINHSFLRENLIDKFYFFIAPKILGGSDGTSVYSGPAPPMIESATDLDITDRIQIGKDMMIEAYPQDRTQS